MEIIKELNKTYDPKKEPNHFFKVGKILFLSNNDYFETLYMIRPDKSLYLCISSQAGCPMGCKFCINKPQNFKRNLSVEEIEKQIYLTLNFLKIPLQDISYLGVMFSGCGEPSLNPLNIIEVIKRLNKLKNVRVLITTIGSNLSGLEKIIKSNIQFSLEISLHAYNDSLRKKLIPSSTPINDLFSLCEMYYNKHKKLIDLNYLLIKEQNDSPKEIIDFFSRLDPKKYCIRISKLNKNNQLSSSSKKQADYIIKRLKEKGFFARYFVSSGDKLIAGCGQLRNYTIKELNS